MKLNQLDLLHVMIDGAVDQWHEGDSNIPLHEFLKLSWEEYREYVENSIIPDDYMRRFEK